MIRSAAYAIAAVAALALAGCGGTPQRTAEVTTDAERVGTSGVAEQQKVVELTAALMSLGPDIDPEEAARVAKISVEYPLFTLAPAYGAVDPALIHNIKVNTGVKPRGLCKHWAEDMETRLKQENLRSFSLHRAIANHNTPRIEHSTVIVSARGDSMENGVVVDPWREGRGVLFWAKVRDDTRYEWWPRQRVFDWKRERGLL